MRIEQVNQNLFIKVMNPIESDLLDMINSEKVERITSLEQLSAHAAMLQFNIERVINLTNGTVDGTRIMVGSIPGAAINPMEHFRFGSVRVDNAITMNGVWQGASAPYTKAEIDTILNGYVKR